MSVFTIIYCSFAGVFGGFALGYMAAIDEPSTARRVALAVLIAYLWPVVVVGALWEALSDLRKVKT